MQKRLSHNTLNTYCTVLMICIFYQIGAIWNHCDNLFYSVIYSDAGSVVSSPCSAIFSSGKRSLPNWLREKRIVRAYTV